MQMLDTAACDRGDPVLTSADWPVLAQGVELLGEMPETGFQDRQWLAVRNGQYVQLTELLYRICEQCDGTHSIPEIAQQLSSSTHWSIDSETLQAFVDKKLAPIGLVRTASAEADRGNAKANSPLGLQLRTNLLGPASIDRVTNVLQVLFTPVLLVPLVALTAAAHVWLYLVHGIASSIVVIVMTPALFLLLLPILVAGLAFHELGHACALKYGGGRARAMGVGLYLLFPAFFTDTSEAYQLPRSARVRTDLGGFYFHAIFTLMLIGTYVITQQEFLLLPILLIDLDVVYQCLPVVRLDGYWALADITGLPDFFSLMGPFVASISPAARWKGTRLPPLRPFARRVFLIYTVLVLPVLIVLGVIMLTRVPWVLTTTWNAEVLQQQLLGQALDAGDMLLVGLALLQMLLLLVPTLGTAYLMFTFAPVVKLAIGRIRRRARLLDHAGDV